jgi:hypothetical protein
MSAKWPLSGTWLSANGGLCRVGGRVTWQTQHDKPCVVEFLTRWPVIKIVLVDRPRLVHQRSSIQARKRSWHAHVPREVGIPKEFSLTGARSRELARMEQDACVFDLTGLAPTASSDFDLRFLSLVETIQAFQKHHPEVAERLGVEVEVRFRDQDP